MKTDYATLMAAGMAMDSLAAFRRNRARNMRYAFGDQWSDTIPDSFGRPVREGDFAAGSGAHPITNNLIRPLVKTIVGRYRTDHAADYASVPLARENALGELDARMLEEFLISGCAVQRVHPEDRPGRRGLWVDNVRPDRFFVNPHSDPRGTDVTLVGMHHYMPLHAVLSRFSRGDASRAAEIAKACSRAEPETESGFYRITEVWTLDAAPLLSCRDEADGREYDIPASEAAALKAENAARRRARKPQIRSAWYAPVHWHCRWLTVRGDLLEDYPSPFVHRSHPFVFRFYPLTDGAVHPFVEDLIEQQRAINRMVTLTDHMMASSAKGVLLFPVESKLPEMKWEEITARWSACDGVIPVRSGREMPRQVSSGNFSAGVAQVLTAQLELFRLSSGVSAVLTGQENAGQRGATMYEQQVGNSVAAIADFLESFASFVALRDAKMAASATVEESEI